MATEMETGRLAADEHSILHATSQLSLPSVSAGRWGEAGLLLGWALPCGERDQGQGNTAPCSASSAYAHYSFRALLPGPFPKAGIGNHGEMHNAQCSLAKWRQSACVLSQESAQIKWQVTSWRGPALLHVQQQVSVLVSGAKWSQLGLFAFWPKKGLGVLLIICELPIDIDMFVLPLWNFIQVNECQWAAGQCLHFGQYSHFIPGESIEIMLIIIMLISILSGK